MKKGSGSIILFFVVAVLVMGIVIFAERMITSDTSLNEIIGGARASKCTDSDGALGYYTKGTCTTNNKDFTDYCQDSYLMEYYCSRNRCLARSFRCPSGYTCSNGACIASVSCTNECDSSGLRQCYDNTSYIACGNYDSDVCLEWSSSLSCPSGYTCSGGACIASCTNECSPSGYSHCTSDLTYRMCGDYDSDVCLEWSSLTCPTSSSCLNGNCIFSNTTG
jgi:hypothetical protein